LSERRKPKRGAKKRQRKSQGKQMEQAVGREKQMQGR